jgi:hypothetical protein
MESRVGGGDNPVTKAFVENTAEVTVSGVPFEAAIRGNALCPGGSLFSVGLSSVQPDTELSFPAPLSLGGRIVEAEDVVTNPGRVVGDPDRSSGVDRPLLSASNSGKCVASRNGEPGKEPPL